MILGSTPKGKIYCFEPQHFQINFNYKREYEPSSTLKRPMRESLDHELLKNQYVSLNLAEVEPSKPYQKLQVLWYNKIHKDSIYFLNIINL